MRRTVELPHDPVDSRQFMLSVKLLANSLDFGPDDSIYVISRDGAPRGKVLRLDAANPDLAEAEVVVPETDGALSNSANTAAGAR